MAVAIISATGICLSMSLRPRFENWAKWQWGMIAVGLFEFCHLKYSNSNSIAMVADNFAIHILTKNP